GRVSPDQRGIEVVGLTAEESVEMVETSAKRPVVEGPGGARGVVRDVVVLAPPAGGVTVGGEDLRNERRAPRNDSGVAGIAGGEFRHDPLRNAVRVAAGEQGSAGGRTDGRRMELAVLQALARQPFRGWSADQAPVGGADAIAGVVEENDDDIRCSCRRLPKSRVIGA